MRHRMAVETGLGNPSPILLNNQWSYDEQLNSIVKEVLSEGIELWFKDLDACDFHIHKDEHCIAVGFGIEPTYKLDPLKIIVVSNNIKYSSFTSGTAFGYYGANVVQKYKRYEEYKKSCKFKNFADKWSKVLQGYFINMEK